MRKEISVVYSHQVFGNLLWQTQETNKDSYLYTRLKLDFKIWEGKDNRFKKLIDLVLFKQF